MAALLTRSTNAAVREVARGLVAARDQQILRVVAMVDAMPERGVADQLIAPLRARLARLRPPRPLRFARLLFLPLDPLIVAAARWRPDEATIPRTVIPLFATLVEAALGPLGKRIAHQIDGSTTQDSVVIDTAGELLWEAAGTVLRSAPSPPDWDAIGLGPRVFAPLASRIGAVLSQAVRLRRMAADAAQGLSPPEASDLQILLTEATEYDPAAQPMLVALLLARVPDCAPVLLRVATLLGQHHGGLLREAGEQAADILLDQLEAPGGAEAHVGGQDLTEAGAAARRLTSLLSALEGEALSPDRRDRLNDIRQRVAAGCQSLFTERLGVDFLEPLRAAVADPGLEATWDLETAARGLRVLETEGRRAGGGKTYDVLLGQAADVVREVCSRGGLDRVGGLRLMEIVAGSEVALALYGDGDPEEASGS